MKSVRVIALVRMTGNHSGEARDLDMNFHEFAEIPRAGETITVWFDAELLTLTVKRVEHVAFQDRPSEVGEADLAPPDGIPPQTRIWADLEID